MFAKGWRLLAALACAAVVIGLAPAAAPAGKGSPSGLMLRPIASFDAPVYATQAPGQPRSIYVVEQPGRVIVVRDGRKRERPFLEISDRVHFGPEESPSEEAGLLSIAFDPGFGKNGRFYVFYVGPNGSNYVDQYRRSGNGVFRADPGSRRRILKIQHPYADSHNGGQIHFGPDGRLWISSGDGGCCGDPYDQARSLGTLLGKLLRINPRPRAGGYRTPRNNPLSNGPGRDAIYAWGLRNPWRFSFDRITGTLTLADVGDQGVAQEEVNFLGRSAARGANFGWPAYQGLLPFDPSRPAGGTPVGPVHTYAQDGGECAITGGYVVRDPGLPQLWGRYLYADFCAGRLRSFVPPQLAANGLPASGATDLRDEGLYARFIASFGEGLDGEIYVVSRAGTVYRLQAKRKREQNPDESRRGR